MSRPGHSSIALLAGALGLTACTRAPSTLPCTSADQCTLDGRAGRCEVSGLCSFDDAACAAGRRYVDDYAGERSGTCVPVELPDWALAIGGATDDALTGIALAPGGQLYAFGELDNVLITPLALETHGQVDMALAAIEPATGEPRWVIAIGGALGDSAGGIGLAGDQIHLAGNFRGSMQLGETRVQKPELAQEATAFHAVLLDGPTGPTALGSAVTYGLGRATPVRVSGPIVVGELHGGTLDVTPGTPADALTAFDAPSASTWIASSTGGAFTTATALGPTLASGFVRGHGAVYRERPSPSVTVVGQYRGRVMYGGSELLPESAMGDGYAVTFAVGSELRPIASQTVGGGGIDRLEHAIEAGGEIVAAGAVERDVTVHGVATQAIGKSDALVYGLDGIRPAWRAGGAASTTVASALAAVPASQDVIVAGTFTSAIRLGGLELTSAGDTDVFVARVAIDGTVAWARRYGGPGADRVAEVAVEPDGRVILAGTFDEVLELGAEARRSSAGGRDWFVLAFRP